LERTKRFKSLLFYLREKGFKDIAAHGTSLGAATIVYSLQENLNFNFIVIESCYDNIDHAFKNRVQKYHLPEFAYLPARYFTQIRIKENLIQLNPLQYIQYMSCRVLMMAGDSEDQLKLDETNVLFQNCGSEHKQLYIFKGGKHEDFLKKFPEEYDHLMNDFLTQNQ
jgi:esterase/lipase